MTSQHKPDSNIPGAGTKIADKQINPDDKSSQIHRQGDRVSGWELEIFGSEPEGGGQSLGRGVTFAAYNTIESILPSKKAMFSQWLILVT